MIGLLLQPLPHPVNYVPRRLRKTQAKMPDSFFQSPALPTELSCRLKTSGGYYAPINRRDKEFRRQVETVSILPILYSQPRYASKFTDVASNDCASKTQSLCGDERIHWPNSNPTSFEIVADGCVVSAVVPGERLNREGLSQLSEF